MEHHRPADLARLIHPRSIALVGASERAGSIGERTLTNLLTHSELAGPLYLVNPSRPELRGQRCWPSVAALPATPDVVVVAVPASGVLAVIEDCAARGVAFAVILSSGFGEAGDQGRRQEQRLQEIAARSGLRLYGPNCPGLTNVNQRLGLTFSPSFPHDLVKGPIGLATQGGGLGRNVMQAMERGIGIGLWASTGNEVDLQVADFIHYMADAPDIRVIVSLLEGIKDGPKFVAAVQRAAANGKPVIVLKVGKSEYGRRAAQSHTAALTGSAQVNSAIFRQFGVVEVDDIDELADTAWLFARAMPGAREALGIYCSSGGTAALTADAVGAAGLRLAAFTPETTALLRARLPDYAAIGNPVDTTAMVLSDQSVVETTLGRVASDANLGLTIVPIALDYGASTTRMADCIIHAQQGCAAPIVPIWMSDRLGEGYQRLVAAGFAPPRSVGKAVSAIRRWVEYGRHRRANPDVGALQRPLAQPGQRSHDGGATRSLGEAQAKQMLQQAGVRLMPNALAKSADEALAHAGRIGYPVVAKIVSADIAHKSDIGGVQVGLRDAAQLQAAWHTIMSTVTARQPGARIAGLLIEKMAAPGSVELMIGVTRDPVFGHVLTFGLGGIYVELLRHVTRRLLPIAARDAAAMVHTVRALLGGARGQPPADIAALEELLVRISDFVLRHADRIEELELNPVWVGAKGQGAIPLDALIIERTGAAA
ncbi:acetate--CoA ligase family protein [Verminephrobacter eiseniae]|uniref:CoA-binding domain protein n=1 Tax=Verminephrobacter eiseniae (strain EF01-2) TaxID=391735 RepID=A1WIV5_VEREI|nr:acetate--CoA ligase family protein [Verminephrobacter eiseniae]ABM57562.1 CoA-binding domain protein [Verminephrobacter eiseniae EF01-2]MCW5283183.1 CoA-binding protein [Verminephrobacter eiseniae]MCW5303499.1 CoA-binding protein [Verminephrobacter eiseniae]MCW8179718.1 CoA-binding protein [Verminephrobacter eiseniae]MCW8188293.1 CoA-binding protein [Verminephrobacter eiseniae]